MRDLNKIRASHLVESKALKFPCFSTLKVTKVNGEDHEGVRGFCSGLSSWPDILGSKCSSLYEPDSDSHAPWLPSLRSDHIESQHGAHLEHSSGMVTISSTILLPQNCRRIRSAPEIIKMHVREYHRRQCKGKRIEQPANELCGLGEE